ncbi:MAG: cytochrome c biogenesis CcdA family protein [Dehalococcoidia bacterium]
MPDMTFLGAFAGGIVSFASPCVLPLVPAYLANIAGASVLTPDLADRRHILLHTISFIIGFSLVYTPLGALLGILGGAAPLGVLEKVAGALLIVFGAFLIAATKVPWLNYEKRLNFTTVRASGYLRSLLIGVVFSLGWIPCTSPILGSIAAVAATSQTAWRGAYLLFAYCLGLGLPFIAVGLAWGSASHYIRWLNRHAFLVSIVAAVLLISIGILMLTGYLEYLSALMPGDYHYGQ